MALRITWFETDSNGKEVGVTHGRNNCTGPVTRLRRWIEDAAIRNGPLFHQAHRWHESSRKPLNASSVRTVAGKDACQAGLVDTDLKPISPRGLRAGLFATACGNGVADDRIMEHARQRNLGTIRGYVRRAGSTRTAQPAT